MKIVNLTPHDVKVFAHNQEIVFPKTGKVARLHEIVKESVDLNVDINGSIFYGVPVVEKTYAEIIDLPIPETNTIFIVSLLVLEVAKAMPFNRTDCLCPDTGKESCVRDEKGNILGVKRFQR